MRIDLGTQLKGVEDAPVGPWVTAWTLPSRRVCGYLFILYFYKKNLENHEIGPKHTEYRTINVKPT